MLRVCRALIYPRGMITAQWNGETFEGSTVEEVIDRIQDRISDRCGEQFEEYEEEHAGGVTDIVIGDQRYTFEFKATLKRV